MIKMLAGLSIALALGACALTQTASRPLQGDTFLGKGEAKVVVVEGQTVDDLWRNLKTGIAAASAA